MPFPLGTHVLTVDPNVIHKVDTANPQNLFSMWTVFSRCAESVEQGRRLENLSWRLWTRETFCCADETKTSFSATTPPRDIVPAQENAIPDVPQLSGSVDSVADEEAVEEDDDFTSDSAPLEIVRPRIRRQDSCASSRSKGKERHITSDNFEKMVVFIVENEPLTGPLHINSPYLEAQKPAATQQSVPPLERSGSTTTESPSKSSDEAFEPSQEPSSPELASRTTVVRGFSPSQTAVVRPARPSPKTLQNAIPEPKSLPPPRPVQTKRQPATFAFGGSASSSDQAQSLETRRLVLPPKKKIFQVGGSSEEESSLKSALHSSGNASPLTAPKKQTSFSNHVTTRTINAEAAVDDQSETDYVDESAIDDEDDSSDWEDSIEDSGKSSIDEKTFFQRVDSSTNLPSRRSLITLMLAQGDRTKNLQNGASQSTSAIARPRGPHGPTLAVSPNDSDEAPLMMKRGVRSTPLRPINEIPRSAAQPILSTPAPGHHQAALSPRTTRRNMLATELTESLRRNLLWERQQKSSTANAVLKRRHTSHDVANLKQYPEKVHMSKNEETTPSQYFSKDAFSGYHSKGW